MDSDTLYTNYLRQGTAGYAVVSKFYFRYADLLAKASLTNVNDVVHEIFISLSKIDFAKVQNAEHYIMRSIKLQCWTLLDKALRLKEMLSATEKGSSAESVEVRSVTREGEETGHLMELDGMELFVQVNLFKAQLSSKEVRLLNMLIDEIDRIEIAKLLEMNLNTLDTNIRRLRIKLAEYLKSLGYTYNALEKFS